MLPKKKTNPYISNYMDIQEARDDVIIPVDAKDMPGSVRRLVEQSLLNVIVAKQSKLDALDFEAQTYVTDTIADYRSKLQTL